MLGSSLLTNPSVRVLRRSQAHLDALGATCRQSQVMLQVEVCFRVLHLCKALQQPHRHVAGLGQGKLLAQADARSANFVFVPSVVAIGRFRGSGRGGVSGWIEPRNSWSGSCVREGEK